MKYMITLLMTLLCLLSSFVWPISKETIIFRNIMQARMVSRIWHAIVFWIERFSDGERGFETGESGNLIDRHNHNHKRWYNFNHNAICTNP